MKIKTTKQMRLDELIKYIYDNEITDEHFDGISGVFRLSVNAFSSIYFDDKFNGRKAIHKEELFTVEVEEELTEDTEIPGATLVYYNELSREIKPFRYADESSPSLKHITQPRSGTEALAVFSGKRLIWSKDTGIPIEGTLKI